MAVCKTCHKEFKRNKIGRQHKYCPKCRAKRTAYVHARLARLLKEHGPEYIEVIRAKGREYYHKHRREELEAFEREHPRPRRKDLLPIPEPPPKRDQQDEQAKKLFWARKPTITEVKVYLVDEGAEKDLQYIGLTKRSGSHTREE